MALTQETFLGSSIRNFSASVGWNSQPSTLEVGLVDDVSHGDNFSPPNIGGSVYFDYQGWKFGGILQNIGYQYGEAGNPIYSVQIQDPRELLSGVQLILQDYTGSTCGIDNLYNIYGYLESFYFGRSLSNEAGVPWKLVRDSFYTLQLTTPIRFRGENYIFAPFVGLDILPDYYRVGGGSISVIDFVDDICAAIACDYFIRMERNIISLGLRSKAYTLQDNAINRYIANKEGAVSKDRGYELSYDTTSKFVVGGKVAELYFQQNDYTSNDKPDKPYTYYDNVITPYWGYDAFDNLIIGNGEFVAPSGTGAEYQFRIDGRPLYIQTGNQTLVNYVTDLEEMRFARMGQDDWEGFLWWKNDKADSVHKGKATKLGLVEGINNGLPPFLGMEDEPVARAAAMVPAHKGRANDGFFESETLERKRNVIYEHIRMYATEYYGKKFMVRIPFVLGAIEPETLNIRLSRTPIGAGYVSEEYWGNAQNVGYMPFNPEKFTEDDDRIQCYARFANMQTFINKTGDGATDLQCKYNLSNISAEDYILDQYPNLRAGKMRENLFVRATVDERLVFLNKTYLTSPRVVITLSGTVADNDDNEKTLTHGISNILLAYLTDLKKGTMTADEVKDKIDEQFGLFGSEAGWFAKDSMFHIPDMVAVPLQNNILRYGPWWATAGAGKVEYEIDDSLVPWDYGGYQYMNLVGFSKVEDALASQPFHERGNIEFPGVPDIQLGDALMEGGPAVTDISVTVGSDGVKTTYRMNTWSYQFGRLGKYNVERLNRIVDTSKKQRKAFRKLFGYAQPIRLSGGQVDTLRHPRRYGKASSATMLAGEVVSNDAPGGSGLIVRSNVAAIAGYRVLSQMSDKNYKHKAGIALDGVFVPYNTAFDGGFSEYMPHFEAPVDGAESPNVNDLNPFAMSNNGISVAFIDSVGVPDNLCTEFVSGVYDVKAIALKAPIIVGGWGYDIDGNPVPCSSGDSTEFVDNYQNRVDQWKVGPLDIRWDGDRKVWTGSGGSSTVNIKVLELNSGLLPSGSAMTTEWVIRHGWEDGDSNPFIKGSGDPIRVYDYLLALGRQQYKGDKIIAGELTLPQESGGTASLWVVLNGQCNC